MKPTYSASSLRDAASLLANAKRIVVLSGAGISKASGIPTYRDAGGLWTIPDNLLKYSHIDAYKNDPRAFSEFWGARLAEIGPAKPNPAHQALRELQDAKPDTVLVTQNVDGLLQAAGCQGVLELHGNLRAYRCGGCGASNKPALFGRCLSCFSRVRPNVVLFGEELPPEVLHSAEGAASKCDVFLVVGTTAEVYPAANLPVIALRWGAKLIVADPNLPLLASAANVVLESKAEEVLPELVERMKIEISRHG
jgi:NAD-dependent deacetylase